MRVPDIAPAECEMNQAVIDDFMNRYRHLPPEDLAALDQQRGDLVAEAVAALDIVLKDAQKRQQVGEVAEDIAKLSVPQPRFGGWLRLLAFGLAMSGPVYLCSMHLFFSEIEAADPRVTSAIVWQNFKFVNWVLGGILTALDLYGLVKLYRHRTRRNIRTVIAILWVGGPVTIFLEPSLDKLMLGSNFNAIYLQESDWMGTLIWSIILVTLWTLYLLKSKRVKALYP